MAYKIGDHMQPTFLPPIIDDYVGPQDPVRVYDAFVDALVFKALGIVLEPQPGADEYYPKDMLKLIIYAYSYGTRSSRKIERACYHNLSFQWLMGGLKPDYRSIARFRSEYKEQIKQVLKQCVHICIDLDLIEGNVLFTDGSKFRANASINNTWTKEKCEKTLKKIHGQIEQLVEGCEHIDQQEDQVQINTDNKHGLIVHGEAVSQNNDLNQLKDQLEKSTENLGKKPKSSCTDSGYNSSEDLSQIYKDIKLIVPSKQQAQEEKGQYVPKPFDKEQFIYDRQADEYICPEGKRLKYQGVDQRKQSKKYQASAQDCRNCQHFGACTSSQSGRTINRLFQEDFRQQLEDIYDSSEGQQIYQLRKEKVEHPFGHFKRNLAAGQFMLRGKAKVDAEAQW